MYTRVLTLSAILAVSAARISSPISLDVRGNQITLSKLDGREVRIITDQVSPRTLQPIVQIHMSGPGVTPKIVQLIDHQALLTGQSQSNTIRQIFSQFRGKLDEESHADLTLALAQQIVNGQISPAVLYSLEVLFDDYKGVQVECPYLNRIYKSQIRSLLATKGGLGENLLQEASPRRVSDLYPRRATPWHSSWDEVQKEDGNSMRFPVVNSEIRAPQQWWWNQHQIQRW